MQVRGGVHVGGGVQGRLEVGTVGLVVMAVAVAAVLVVVQLLGQLLLQATGGGRVHLQAGLRGHTEVQVLDAGLHGRHLGAPERRGAVGGHGSFISCSKKTLQSVIEAKFLSDALNTTIIPTQILLCLNYACNNSSSRVEEIRYHVRCYKKVKSQIHE